VMQATHGQPPMLPPDYRQPPDRRGAVSRNWREQGWLLKKSPTLHLEQVS